MTPPAATATAAGTTPASPTGSSRSAATRKNEFPGELYNLRDDLTQRRNLYGEKPEVVRRLKALLEKYKAAGPQHAGAAHQERPRVGIDLYELFPVAASRQSAATCPNRRQRRSAETPLRLGSGSQCPAGLRGCLSFVPSSPCCRLQRLAAPAARPNIVIILADDQGWGDLSVNGNSNLSTPRIDSLAKDGALLERFYVCPVCSPTRAEFLTGRYHPRGGVHGVSTGGERLNLDEKTIGDTFKAAGYATGAFGKWHNGTQYPYHPNARGFDEFYGFCSGHWGIYFDPPLEHNGKLVQGKGFIIDDLTDHAMKFIEKNKRRPFFCYVPFNTPHSPMQVPDRFYRKFANARTEAARPQPGAGGCRLHPRRAGDVREH